MHDTTMQPYVLGHSETELRRLAMQSRLSGMSSLKRSSGAPASVPECTSSTSAPVLETLQFSQRG
jgi:hypothetical protein